MSNQVRVGDYLQFGEQAAIDRNVKGDMLPERMTSIDWFDGDTLDTNKYTVTIGGGSDAIALGQAGENGVKFTTGTVDNNVCYLATGLIFDVTNNPSIETKLEITDVSGSFVFFGFSDAVTETTPHSTIDADGGTLANVATDAVGFVIDADLSTSSIYCASVKTQSASGTVQSVDSGTDWTDTVSHRLRVKLDASGNAYFYMDGLQVGYIALAVADVPLCAMFNAGTRADDGANTIEARYLAKWQDVP